ncbi:hypothetical protein GCM10017790_62680 [Amycolatopsis oliviviridis]|uniref:Secreted protein n=1 Tax=Amycolatopsis oliviviridis TaxID=1471590 RepID=A0ABQ3M219_9PSEU|nr:hypothetical protein GCM10017790_62680 [Amycolatopsis oliviviridis]
MTLPLAGACCCGAAASLPEEQPVNTTPAIKQEPTMRQGRDLCEAVDIECSQDEAEECDSYY